MGNGAASREKDNTACIHLDVNGVQQKVKHTIFIGYFIIGHCKFMIV